MEDFIRLKMCRYIFILIIGLSSSFLHAETPCLYSTCPDGMGSCEGHYVDSDGDGYGRHGLHWICSLDPGDYVTNDVDFNDECYCADNEEEKCFDCEARCKFISITGAVNTEYLAYNNTSLNYDCPDAIGEMAGRKGCDECGSCDGSGKTWYPDADVDGFGDQEAPGAGAGSPPGAQ